MELKEIMDALAALGRDKRVSVWHVGIYTAILQLYYKGNLHNPVLITRRKIMQIAHIGSIATYHKCLRELDRYGYITYIPSYHPLLGSKIFLTAYNDNLV